MEEIAIFISVVSLVLAYWSRKIAEKANNITRHHYQLEIYDVFLELRSYIENTLNLNSNEIQKYKYLFRNTKFYFDNEFVINLEKYYQNCFSFAVLDRRCKENLRNGEAVEEIRHKQDSLEKERDQLLTDIEKQFNKDLKI